MLCPNCGRTMESGYLSAGGYRIKWTAKARSFSNLPFAGSQDVLLQKTRLTGKNDIHAHICKVCRKIILDY